MARSFDVLVAGGGPAGAVCAAACARAGLSVAVIERAVFPREKVCGDCLNPGCWRVLDALGLRHAVMVQEHAQLDWVEIGFGSRKPVRAALPAAGTRREIALARHLLDTVLLDHARSLGAEIFQGTQVRQANRSTKGWQVISDTGDFHGKWLVAADGRNSTVCRHLGILPGTLRDRVALQTYARLLPEAAGAVGLRVLPMGYCGYADIGGGRLNLCLVGRPERLTALRQWATGVFRLDAETVWRNISPIERGTVAPAADRLLLVGDAARVVEPFTGEGIRYAMESGWLAAQCLTSIKDPGEVTAAYIHHWHGIYRGRLWVNAFARTAVKHPALASAFLAASAMCPPLLRSLTSKVVAG